MLKLALIGTPIKQSLSPLIHQVTMKALGILGTYELLETQPEDLVDAIKYLKANEYAGFNVTIPLKIPVTLFLEEVDDIANLAGAVNTVKIADDKFLYGYNTDVFGFKMGFSDAQKRSLIGKKATILGTGGVSRAVVIALNELGVKQIEFYSGHIDKARELINFFKEKFPNISFEIKNYSSKMDLSNSKCLINTTPLGTYGKYCGVSPIDDTTIQTLTEDAIVYDLVYNPRQTEFLKQASKAGLSTISGIDMLIYQGLQAFSIWTDNTVPMEEIKKLVLAEID